MRTDVAGYYKFEAVYPDGRVEVLRDWTNNLILDQGLDYFYSGGDGERWYRYCSLGTGTTGPADTDTALQNFLVAQSIQYLFQVSRDTSGVYPYQNRMVTWYDFPIGAVTSFYEVGIGCANDGTLLVSRIVLRDADGVLAPITVPATAALRIYWSLYLYPPLEDTTQDFTLSGVDIVATIRSSDVNPSLSFSTSGWLVFTTGIIYGSAYGRTTWYVDYLDESRQSIYSGAIGDIFSSPSSRITNGVSVEVHPYSIGARYRDFTVTFPTGATPVRSMVFYTTCGVWQIQFEPPIPRDTLGGVKFTMRHSIGRYVSNIVPYKYKETLVSDLTVQSVTLT